MGQHYSVKSRETEVHALPDIETFYVNVAGDSGIRLPDLMTDGEGEPLEPGWYWWSCFPGCLPDSDPMGPFDSEEEALADAREGVDDE